MKARYILLSCLMGLLVHTAFAQAPIEFIENKGQWGDWFRYKAATQGGTVCLENDGFRYVLADVDNNYKVDYYHHGQTRVKPILKFHVYKVTFLGAGKPELVGERPQKVYYNYYLGNDMSRWKSGIHPMRSVNYNKLYDGIDMHVSSAKGNMEYDLIVKPQADASLVKMKFDGQDDIRIKNHNLVISTTVGQVTEMKPYAYQYINDTKVEVACEYKLKGNVLTFEFPKGYDHSQQLIIDPVVVLCTLTGSTADNWGFTATYDDAGNFYAGGLVNDLAYPGTHFPVSPGAFQTTFGGGLTYVDPATSQLWAYAADISIIKYDPTLRNRIYATYLGGAGNDHPHSMIVDGAQNLIVAGRTISTNYPVTSGAYQPTNRGGWDICLTKFNAAGSALLGSTYIGGTGHDGVNYDSTEYGYGELKYNYGDDARSEVQMDRYGNIFMAGCTNSTDFPVTSTALSASLSGLQDGVVFKFDPTLSSLQWSTYIGGTGSDAGYVLAFDTAHTSVYVGGGTNSRDFQTTPGTIHPSYQGGFADGFVMKFKNAPPYNLERSSYLGQNDYDQVYGIQVSSNNELYAMGQSLGGTFPVSVGVHSNPNSSQFVMKLDSNITTNLLSTVFGSGVSSRTNISPVAFLVDTCENVYISGWGGNLGIPGIASGECGGMEVSPDAEQPTTDGRDFYFIVFGPGLASLRYATYHGRNCSTLWEGEHVDGGTSRFAKQGIIYQGICANCGGTDVLSGACPDPFPTTTGVWSEVDSSRNCNEAALKINFNIGPVEAKVTAGPNTSGCAPLLVNFTNTSNNGLTYVWNFGDGSPTVTTYSTSHLFTTAGTYTVTLAAANSNACFKTNDTAYIIINVDTNVITPDFTCKVLDSCGPYVASFTNTSIDRIGTPTYKWFFGDGTSYTGVTPPDHNYPDTGRYTIMLIMSDPNACKSPDTTLREIHLYGLRVAGSFTIPDSLCLGSPFSPLPFTTNATSVLWLFGDGNSSTTTRPSYTFDSAGTYTVTFIVQNSGACNGADTIRQRITILSTPIANFSFVPVKAVINEPTVFTNLSKNAVRYLWEFGDNTTGTEVNPIHQYNKTGSYKVCLNAYNISNCPSKLCRMVPAEIQPIVGLPTAFSPNGDGENDILYVRGAAIKTLDLKIFNRWGQLIFETTSQDVGWDGTYNGQPQPVEAYGYVLNVSFIDSSVKQMKGNITLLR